MVLGFCIEAQTDSGLVGKQFTQSRRRILGKRLGGPAVTAEFRGIYADQPEFAAVTQYDGIAVMNMRDAGALVDPVRAATRRLREQRQDSEQGDQAPPKMVWIPVEINITARAGLSRGTKSKWLLSGHTSGGTCPPGHRYPGFYAYRYRKDGNWSIRRGANLSQPWNGS